MSKSFLNRPADPPSSLTETTAVTSTGCSLKPESKQDIPVPPPKATTLGVGFFSGVDRSDFNAESFRGHSLNMSGKGRFLSLFHNMKADIVPRKGALRGKIRPQSLI